MFGNQQLTNYTYIICFDPIFLSFTYKNIILTSPFFQKKMKMNVDVFVFTKNIKLKLPNDHVEKILFQILRLKRNVV